MPIPVGSQVPFPESFALNTERLVPRPDSSGQNFSSPTELTPHVPGDPIVSLDPADVSAHLSAQLETRLLDELYDRLWLVARKSGHSIDALHVQRIKGRNIVPSEDPRLHLVWQHDKIYIKPLPVSLLNYDFWATYLRLPEKKKADATSSSSGSVIPNFDRSVAVGFLRSYAFLINHQLDFILAKDSRLIPEDVDWVKWSKFINNFRKLEDNHVAKRYHYGQLRLSRLNWVVRLFRPQHASTGWFYEIPHWSITEYVTWATLPFLFMFASISLALSSMQVALSVPADGLWFQRPDGSGLRYMSRAFWVFSIGVLLLSGVIWMLLLGIPLLVLVWQISWGFQKREKETRATGNSNV
ncbi:uncharacterized protein K441DRAFT_592462 [Cenococcum geophilum 1.58]|uniref:Uncharacterized protein n=1 Tax=Cenococcum geophilum 1.58 TaxID=794803 RepID=A0ACC8EN34_9PEZI|nr:hypothetical protein K441DRAFT_592462 [Cenococcum geophilum 1.58]